MRKYSTLLLLLAGCSNNNPPPTPQPSPGPWTCYNCNGVVVNGDGSFNFPGSGGAVGYIYSAVSGNPIGKTITMNYTVSGTGTVLPSPESGEGSAQVRLFLWRANDDMQCTATTEWYRWWSQSGAGPLTAGTYQISAPVVSTGWTDCYAHTDPNQFAATTANLLGAGFTFGAKFFGHGVYSNDQNSFKLNSFGVK